MKKLTLHILLDKLSLESDLKKTFIHIYNLSTRNSAIPLLTELLFKSNY